MARRPRPASSERKQQPREPAGSALALRERSLATVAITRSPYVAAIVNWLFPAYVAVIAIGFLIFWRAGVVPIGGDSSDRSLFNAVNAATLTGFPSSFGVPEFFPLGQWTAALLMIAGTLFSLIVGGLAVARICRIAISDAQVVLASVLATLLAPMVGSIVGLAFGQPVLQSMFFGVSAFGNVGLVPTSDSPGPLAPVMHVLLLPLSVVGGIGITVLLELVARIRGREMSRHAAITLAGIGAMYLLGFAGLLASKWPASGVPTDPATWRAMFAEASADAINVRSAGFPLATLAEHTRVAVWLMLGLMMVGAGSGGTAGGLKVTTLHELYAGTRRALAGERVSRSFGIAISWLGMFLLAIAVTQALLVHALPEVPTDRLLFLAVSAVSNVGLSHDPVSFVGNGLYALSAGMFAGRVLPLLVLWWMADTTTDAELAIG